MRSLFWTNFCLAIFFGFFELVMLVVIVLYSYVLGDVRTSPEELHGILLVTLYVAGFVAASGLTAWGLRPTRKGKRPTWVWPSQASAILMAILAIAFIRDLAG